MAPSTIRTKKKQFLKFVRILLNLNDLEAPHTPLLTKWLNSDNLFLKFISQANDLKKAKTSEALAIYCFYCKPAQNLVLK